MFQDVLPFEDTIVFAIAKVSKGMLLTSFDPRHGGLFRKASTMATTIFHHQHYQHWCQLHSQHHQQNTTLNCFRF